MKIAKIIDTRSIVINAGIDAKIKIGDQLQIVGSKGPKVKDPDTGKELGTLDAIKGRVIVTQIYAHMAIAEAIKYRDKSRFNTAFIQSTIPSSSIQDIIYGPEVQKDLPVDLDEITGGYEENNDPIRVGDIVERI